MNDVITQNWVKTQAVAEVEGVRIHSSNFISERNAPRHVHQEYVFGLAITGTMEIDCGHCGATHIVQPNDLMLTEAHEVYSSRALGLPPWRYVSISVSKEKLGLLLDTEGGKEIKLPHFTQGAVKNDKFRSLFLKLHDSLNDGRTALEQESLLSAWVVSVNEIYSDEQNSLRQSRRIYSESGAVRRVREFIRENVSENIKLQDLAEVANLSPFHLNRAFSAQIGLPPHEFQSQLRIEKAAKLLARKKPLAEIAFETGFSDQSHFNRFFKRYVGVTPKKFVAR